MSIMTISDELYDRIFTNTIAVYINQGHDLTSARALASDQVPRAFLPLSVALQSELEKDLADDRFGLTS